MSETYDNLLKAQRIQKGRRFAAGLLLAELCICDDGLAGILGLGEPFARLFPLRAAVCIFLTVYFLLIKKHRIETAEEWFRLLEEDRVTRLLWIAQIVVLGLDLLP